MIFSSKRCKKGRRSPTKILATKLHVLPDIVKKNCETTNGE